MESAGNGTRVTAGISFISAIDCGDHFVNQGRAETAEVTFAQLSIAKWRDAGGGMDDFRRAIASGMTTIMGFALFWAMSESMIKLALPTAVQPLASSL